MQQTHYDASSYTMAPQNPQQYFHEPPSTAANSYSLSSLSNPSATAYSNLFSQAQSQQYSSQQQWPPQQDPYSSWPNTPSSASFGTQQQMRPSSYPPPPQQQQQAPAHWATSPFPESTDPLGQSFPRSISPAYNFHSGGEARQPSPQNLMMSDNGVPPPRPGQRRVSPSNSRDQYGGGGRSAGHPPVGITRCSSCRVTQSPEWRKGPSGKKDLCNAYVHFSFSDVLRFYPRSLTS